MRVTGLSVCEEQIYVPPLPLPTIRLHNGFVLRANRLIILNCIRFRVLDECRRCAFLTEKKLNKNTASAIIKVRKL